MGTHHPHNHQRKPKVSRVELAFLLIVALVIFAIFDYGGARMPTASSETRFVENSKKGLQIVPASCPSNPHNGENCYSQGSYYSEGSYFSGYSQGGYQTYSQGYYQGSYDGTYSQGYYQGSYCSAQYFCRGDDLYYKNNQCTESFVQACAYGCSGGGCLPPGPPSGHITADPQLVKSGKTSEISWTSQRTTSCTVTENNGDIDDQWTGLNGTRTSSALTQQTKYTLTCQGIQGAVPSTFSDSVTINIIPIFEEQ